jgi:hypothetical protein
MNRKDCPTTPLSPNLDHPRFYTPNARKSCGQIFDQKRMSVERTMIQDGNQTDEEADLSDV